MKFSAEEVREAAKLLADFHFKIRDEWPEMLEAFAELLEQLPYIFKDIKALGNEADRLAAYYKEQLE